MLQYKKEADFNIKDCTRRITALVLCAALVLGGAGIARAKTGTSAKETDAPEAQQTEAAQTTATNAETVYVLAGADGSVQKIIVSGWNDTPDNDTYTISGEQMTVWDAAENNIYTQADANAELPVNIRVSYQLNGKTISPEALAGKSGKIRIRFDYDNTQYSNVDIDGKEETLYVPFAMLTGMILPNDTFQNIQISNGKLIDNGEHTILAGLAFPGLQEDLNINASKLEIPDYLEITADVTNFSLGMTVTLATNEIFSQLETEKLDSLDALNDALAQLTDAMNQLLDGSSGLYDGLGTLLEKSDALVSGVNQLAAGAKRIVTGAESLEAGTAELKAKLSELATGLSTLSANSASLNQGAQEVFQSLLSTATTQIQAAGLSVPALSIDNYSTVLKYIG